MGNPMGQTVTRAGMTGPIDISMFPPAHGAGLDAVYESGRKATEELMGFLDAPGVADVSAGAGLDSVEGAVRSGLAEPCDPATGVLRLDPWSDSPVAGMDEYAAAALEVRCRLTLAHGLGAQRDASFGWLDGNMARAVIRTWMASPFHGSDLAAIGITPDEYDELIPMTEYASKPDGEPVFPLNVARRLAVLHAMRGRGLPLGVLRHVYTGLGGWNGYVRLGRELFLDIVSYLAPAVESDPKGMADGMIDAIGEENDGQAPEKDDWQSSLREVVTVLRHSLGTEASAWRAILRYPDPVALHGLGESFSRPDVVNAMTHLGVLEEVYHAVNDLVAAGDVGPLLMLTAITDAMPDVPSVNERITAGFLRAKYAEGIPKELVVEDFIGNDYGRADAADGYMSITNRLFRKARGIVKRYYDGRGGYAPAPVSTRMRAKLDIRQRGMFIDSFTRMLDDPGIDKHVPAMLDVLNALPRASVHTSVALAEFDKASRSMESLESLAERLRDGRPGIPDDR